MKATIEQQLNDLLMRRERIKLDLMEKQAQQAQEHYRYIAFGESVSLEDRLALQAQIASLEADRQSTKVHLIAMKQKAKELRARELIWLRGHHRSSRASSTTRVSRTVLTISCSTSQSAATSPRSIQI